MLYRISLISLALGASQLPQGEAFLRFTDSPIVSAMLYAASPVT